MKDLLLLQGGGAGVVFDALDKGEGFLLFQLIDQLQLLLWVNCACRVEDLGDLLSLLDCLRHLHEVLVVECALIGSFAGGLMLLCLVPLERLGGPLPPG